MKERVVPAPSAWQRREGLVCCPFCHSVQLWKEWQMGGYTCPDCGASVVFACSACEAEYTSKSLRGYYETPWGFSCPMCGQDMGVSTPTRVVL